MSAAETDMMNLQSASSRLLWPAPADWERNRMLVPLFKQMVKQRGRIFRILSLKKTFEERDKLKGERKAYMRISTCTYKEKREGKK